MRRSCAAWHPLALLLAGCAARTSALPAATPAPGEASVDVRLEAPLPVDPQVVIGKLPNGMTYWIRRNATPPGKVNVWLHVAAGSLGEREDERGVAHFAEHMAFNGTRNFPPGTTARYFESLGLSFGGDQNAFTNYDQTTYQLRLPDPRPETLRKGLTWLSDCAFRRDTRDPEVNRERPVVQGEERAEKGLGQRFQDRFIPLYLPGSLVARRKTIGTPESLARLSAATIDGYLGRWYRPDLTTLIVAGDVDPAALVPQIAEAFAAWPRPAAAPPAVDPGVTPYTADRAAVLVDPEMPAVVIGVARVAPVRAERTLADVKVAITDQLAIQMLNRRFGDLVRKGKVAFQGAEVSIDEDFLHVARQISSQAEGRPERWKEILGHLVRELKRARSYGFSQDELADVRRGYLAWSEERAQQQATWDSSSFVSNMNGELTRGRKPASTRQWLAVDRALLPAITLDEVNATFRRNYAPGARLVLFVGPDKPGSPRPSEAELTAALAAAEAAPVEPPTEEPRITRLLERAPVPGKVAERKEWPALGITALSFSNGVQVRIRPMTYKKDWAGVRIVLQGGDLREDAATVGLASAGGRAFANPTTRRFSSTQIRNFFTGLNVEVSGGQGADALTLDVSGMPRDLEAGLALAHLLLTEPVIEPAPFEVWKEAQLIARRHELIDVDWHRRYEMGALLASGDPRNLATPTERIGRLTVADAQRWLDGQLRTAPIEVGIVGDMPLAQAEALAARYLGSLPARPRSDPELARLRRIRLRAGPVASRVEVDTITPRGSVQVAWRSPDRPDRPDRDALVVAYRILDTRIREQIREKLGLTYTPWCDYDFGWYLWGTSTLSAGATVDPERADETVKQIRAVFERFAESGPTDEELATARKQLETSIRTEQREPGYWLDRLSQLDLRGRTIEEHAGMLDTLLSFSAADVRAVARKYIRPERRFVVVSVPRRAPVTAAGRR